MQRLEVSGAVRLIYVVRRQRVNNLTRYNNPCTDPEGSRSLRLPVLQTIGTSRLYPPPPPPYPGNIPGSNCR